MYEGDTALHAAGFSYDAEMARDLITRGADIRLGAGADPHLQNDRGSAASDLAHWTTGRGGTGSAAAKAEQRIILELLEICTP